MTLLVPWALTTSNCAFKAIHRLRAHVFHLPKHLLGCACLHRVCTPPLRSSQQLFCSERHPSRQVRLCHTSLSDDIIFAVFLPEPTLHSSRGLQLLPDSPSNAVENDLWILISVEGASLFSFILFLGPVLWVRHYKEARCAVPVLRYLGSAARRDRNWGLTGTACARTTFGAVSLEPSIRLLGPRTKEIIATSRGITLHRPPASAPATRPGVVAFATRPLVRTGILGPLFILLQNVSKQGCGA